MDLVKENTNNMTSLWKLGGRSDGFYFSNDSYAISRAPHSQWPNKLWFHKSPDSTVMNEVSERWDLKDITTVTWSGCSPKDKELLKSHGLALKNSLTGMSLDLKTSYRRETALTLQEVKSSRSAIIWSQLFVNAFGYQIHPVTIEKTMHDVRYFIAISKKQHVGTVAIYQIEPLLAGIHSMGIVSDQRRKGFAENILSGVLEIVRRKGARYAMLQASQMGKPLYQKIGFREDFELQHFINTK
ncbi:MAG: GNAT family N-acetyltransferase [Cyclobacteriaceae bacterium]